MLERGAPVPPAAAPVTRPSLTRALEALHVRPFRRWFAAQVLSASGSMTQAVAQAWLVLELTGSAIALGALPAALFLPVLLGSAQGGALADRADRRRVLVATQALFVVLALALGTLVVTGAVRVWMVFAFAAAWGCVLAVDQPARQVYALDLVGRERIGSAVSLNEIVINASRVLGPAAGGALLATVGISTCFFVTAASFLPALVVLARMPRTQRDAARARSGERGTVREGLRYVRRAPAIRASVVIACASGMVFNLGVVAPLLATRVFDLGAGGYGAMMAAFGVGAVPGALAAAAGGPWPSGRSVRLLALATGVAVVLTAFSPWLVGTFVGLVAAGFLSIWWVTSANTLVQVRADPSLRGRVMGIWTMALPGTNPLTGLAAGAVAAWLGARAGFALGGIAMIATAAAGWRALADR